MPFFAKRYFLDAEEAAQFKTDFPEDVERLVAACGKLGLGLTEREVIDGHASHSFELNATWLAVPEAAPAYQTGGDVLRGIYEQACRVGFKEISGDGY